MKTLRHKIFIRYLEAEQMKEERNGLVYLVE